jgi:large subunit ribosomal protein L35
MGYKFKPSKSVAKRFRATKTGKLKHNHCFTSHLMSARPANKRRKLRRPANLAEGHARNMRSLMGISAKHPNKIRHDRELAAQEESANAETAQAETVAAK